MALDLAQTQQSLIRFQTLQSARLRRALTRALAQHRDLPAVLLLTALNSFIRFWRLTVPDTQVFDEVYFPVFARNYLDRVPFFDAHPPLGKYLISLGIHLFGFNPLGYRVVDALFGVGVVILIYRLCALLFRSRRVAFWAGFLASLDGLLLVESRAGLINIFAVFFSLLAYELFLRSRAPFPRKPRWLYLAGAGAASGAAAAVKWIGAASLGVILLTYAWSWLRSRRSHETRLPLQAEFPKRIGRIHPGLILTCCVVLPAAVYAGSFIPHLRQNHDYSFLELHKQMFGYHAHLQEGHRYASRWWSWPLALRPVSYYWQVDEAKDQVSTILNLGNPILWWLSIPTMLVGVWFAVKKKSFPAQFCVLAFALHYLPFAFIGRATFSYHYMGALPFVFMLQGFILEKLWQVGGWRRELAFVMLLAAFFSAVYFYPIWTALPIPLGAFYQRMWLVSWI